MPYHILLVDDDPDFRREFAETLLDDYRMTEASGGNEALQETRARGDITTGGVEGKIERVKHFLEVNYHKSVRLEDAGVKLDPLGIPAYATRRASRQTCSRP